LVEAARIRTLPLSVSGIIVGSMYALANPTDYIPTEVFNWRIFSFAIITTLGLQILILPMIMVTASKERITRIEAKGDSKWRNYSKEMKGFIITLLTLLSAILLIFCL
jgi:1,4-dihydroxy-2-naphthoate octaprenyltransferase